MSTSSPSDLDLLACAVEAATVASTHAMTNRSRRREVLQAYHHDVKLLLDGECQRKAEEVIRGAYPAHAVLGEEDPEPSEPAQVPEYRWVIDPIDGTVNFSHGLPFWCCAVAVQRRGQTVAGAVVAPEAGERYTAARGQPAHGNGRPLAVSTTGRLAEAMVMTGLDKLVEYKLPSFAVFTRLAAAARKARVMGCAALDMCRVASGQADGYFEAGIYLWDVAAAGLVVECAGGCYEVVDRLPQPYRLCSLATNGRIHAEMRELVTQRG